MSLSTRPTLLVQTSIVEDLASLIPFEHPFNHPDVIIIGGGEESLTIDMVRELQSKILQTPYQADFVVFILQSVDAATVEAQQALLKMLEEPPKHIQFILMAQYPTMLLPTILSRTVLVETGTTARSQTNSTSSAEKNLSEKITDLLTKSLSDRLVWAGAFSKPDESSREVAQLIESATDGLEHTPQLGYVESIKVLNHTLELLQKRVNPKLSMEWCVLHLPQN